MNTARAARTLVLIYCFICLGVVVCMPLYRAFFVTDFGMLCFRAGALLTLISTFNPLGLIGIIMNFSAFRTMDPQEAKKHWIWAIISPVLVIVSYLLALCFFVGCSGGV